MSTVDFGREGERLASEFLETQGYEIVERNYRQRFGEIDIIAWEKGTLCFVEVKLRETDDYGHPFEAVTSFKQRTIRKVAQMYLLEEEIGDHFVRFDIVGIWFPNFAEPEIELLKNAF